MRIVYELETFPNGTTEKLTNFRIAEAILDLCDEDFKNEGLDAETVAQMLLLQLDSRKKVQSDENN